jgi:hypothetical protein
VIIVGEKDIVDINVHYLKVENTTQALAHLSAGF